MNLMKQLWRFTKLTRRIGGWRAAMSLARQIPQQVALITRLLNDGRVPISGKVVLIGGVAFAFSPLNVPQYIPVLGALDDIGIVMLAANFFMKRVPRDVLAIHRRAVGLPTGLVEI
jgi:uncharacterized membrane protein YkvA (DUF1232 family)